jgi:hypothetical protein
MRIEEGNEDGIRPNSELLLRFTTLSSTSCDELFDENIPWRFNLSTTYRTTILFLFASCSKDNKTKDS